jgi:hypothetical protein
MSKLLEKIKSQGHWQVVIRPEIFEEERIATLAECEQILGKCQVRQRGWYFPHMDSSRLIKGLDYIELETDFPLHPESWRLYQSGQFAFWRALGEDNLDKFPGGSPYEAQPGEWLGVITTLYELSEIYEFAARLAQTGIFADQLQLGITLLGVQGRKMEFHTPARSMGMDCECIELSLPRSKAHRTADFIPRARDLALQHFLWITERFQCPGTERVFRRDQEKFFEGRF